MPLPTLPDWLPWWVTILVLIPFGLWALALLVMPFSVIGLKSRLEGLEARLDEIQAEIRSLVLRLPEAPERMAWRDEAPSSNPAPDDRYVRPAARPPIPPAPRAAAFVPRRPDELRAERPASRTDQRGSDQRAEPRLDWRQ